MFALFHKTVVAAEIPLPAGLRPHSDESKSAFEDGYLAREFRSAVKNSFVVDLRPACMLASVTDVKQGQIPSLYALKDDVFCLLHGRIDNISELRPPFKLNTQNDQPTILIDAYRRSLRLVDDSQPRDETLKEARTKFWFSLLKSFRGRYAFVLFDNVKRTFFATADVDASLLFYWGLDMEENLVFSSDSETMKKGCQKFYGSFPKGCYMATGLGLRTLADPGKDLPLEHTLTVSRVT